MHNCDNPLHLSSLFKSSKSLMYQGFTMYDKCNLKCLSNEKSSFKQTASLERTVEIINTNLLQFFSISLCFETFSFNWYANERPMTYVVCTVLQNYVSFFSVYFLVYSTNIKYCCQCSALAPRSIKFTNTVHISVFICISVNTKHLKSKVRYGKIVKG